MVTNGDEITGVITDGDLRRMLMQNEDVSGIIAQQIMSKNPKPLTKILWQKCHGNIKIQQYWTTCRNR